MVILLALTSALANALTSILQRMGVEDAPVESTLKLSLLTHALRRGVWLLGFAFMVGSFLLQAVALHLGDLSQVQPILTTELLFIVLLLATWFRFRVGLREWLGCLAAAGGLAGFLIFAQPGGGDQEPTTLGWIVVASICVGVITVAVLLALRGPRWWRAAMFGTAGAIGFALTASFIKAVGDYVASDWTQLFVHWQTYALIISGVASLFLAQNAYHAGPIAASQTALVLVDPLASLAIGIGLFGDLLRTTGVFGPLEAVSLIVMFVGVASIAHSPLISGTKGDDDRYSEMLSLRSRSKRLAEAVRDQVPAEAIRRMPSEAQVQVNGDLERLGDEDGAHAGTSGALQVASTSASGTGRALIVDGSGIDLLDQRGQLGQVGLGRYGALPVALESEVGRSERHRRQLDGGAGHGADLYPVHGPAAVGSGLEQGHDGDGRRFAPQVVDHDVHLGGRARQAFGRDRRVVDESDDLVGSEGGQLGEPFRVPAGADDPAGAQAFGHLHGHPSGVAGGPEDQDRLARLEGNPAAQGHPGGHGRVHGRRHLGHVDGLRQRDDSSQVDDGPLGHGAPACRRGRRSRPAGRPAAGPPRRCRGSWAACRCWCSAGPRRRCGPGGAARRPDVDERLVRSVGSGVS